MTPVSIKPLISKTGYQKVMEWNLQNSKGKLLHNWILYPAQVCTGCESEKHSSEYAVDKHPPYILSEKSTPGNLKKEKITPRTLQNKSKTNLQNKSKTKGERHEA